LHQGRLALRQRRLRLGQRRDVGLLVDDEQQRADFQALALDRQLLFQHAADARPYFDGVDRLGLGDVVLRDRGRLRRHGNRGDVCRRRRGRALLAAGHQHQGSGANAKCPSHHVGIYGNSFRVRHNGVLSNTHRFFSHEAVLLYAGKLRDQSGDCAGCESARTADAMGQSWCTLLF